MQREVPRTTSERVKTLLREPMADPHVNMGRNLDGAHSDMLVYEKKMPELNIVFAIVKHETTYELRLPDGSIEKSCLWYVRNGRTTYKKITRTGNSVNEEINPKDPYVNANYAVLNYLESRNKETVGSVIHFAPIVHPILDSQENLERFIAHPLTAVVKVHGISSHTGPEEMPEWIPKLATKHNKPLLVHTDYVDRPDNAPSLEIAKLRLMNQPINWLNWAQKNDTRLYLAHGIRLDPASAKIVNNSDRFLVGTGPDYYIDVEQERLMLKGNYLSNLFKILEPSRIAIDSDFAWNWKDGGKKELDWDFKERTIVEALDKRLSTEDVKGVLKDNASRFFNIGR